MDSRRLEDRVKPSSVEGLLSWPEDGAGFSPKVKELGRSFRYTYRLFLGRSKRKKEMYNFTKRINSIYEKALDFDFFGLDDHSDFWNFGYWLEFTANHRQACENLLERLLTFIPDKKETILDVACGKGATTRYLLKYYKPQNVTGINISTEQLQRCQKNAPGCTFLWMDATHLRFPNDSFDNIICVEAAVHFDTREKFLQEAQRVLKPGGRLVLSDALLAPWAPMQPVANYLRGPGEYQQLCLRTGFAEAVTFDVTEQCWGGLADYLMRSMHQRFLDGEIGIRRFYEGIEWVRKTQTSVESYVLGACTKR
jgi:MPBQ/MSBQ methyltransferase